MTDPRLSREVAIYRDVTARIAALYDIDCTDEQVLLDTVEGETSLHEFLGEVLREAVAVEAYAKAIPALVRQLHERKERLETRAHRLRAAVLWAMGEAGLKKLPLPDMTVSIGAARAPLIIRDDEAVPDEYCHPPKKAPDRIKIREALNNGAELAFAFLGNKEPSLNIRSK